MENKTAEEIKELALSEYADTNYPFNDKVDAYIKGYMDAQDQFKPQWIKCSGRLPEIGKEVNVYTATGIVTSLCRYIRYEGATSYYWNNHNGQGNMYLQEAVTYWMELPENPKD